jgi:uncharacterized membrane protein
MTGETLGRFKRWFWRPPRSHGDTIADRRVSFLELFYDLVYVAVISQAAHHLAEHVSVRGLAEFAVVFALIWIAWINGSLYLELHGREDGRTRSIVFAQMGILVLLAVFTADAGRLVSVFGPLGLAMTAAAVAALLVGWMRPVPWLLALLLVAILSVLWSFAVGRFLRADAWGQP